MCTGTLKQAPRRRTAPAFCGMSGSKRAQSIIRLAQELFSSPPARPRRRTGVRHWPRFCDVFLTYGGLGALDRPARAAAVEQPPSALLATVPPFPEAGEGPHRRRRSSCRSSPRSPSWPCSPSSARWSTAWRRVDPRAVRPRTISGCSCFMGSSCSSSRPFFSIWSRAPGQPFDHAEPFDASCAGGATAMCSGRASVSSRTTIAGRISQKVHADRHGAPRKRRERHRRRLVFCSSISPARSRCSSASTGG